jgi:glycosyltransferase involved in cell wall biosynthesis
VSVSVATPRVVHVVGGLGLGGGQKLTALVAAGLHRAGYDVTVINLAADGEYEDYLRLQGVPVVCLGMRGGRGLRSTFANLVGVLSLWTVLRRGRWDIVHTHMFRTALVTVPLGRLLGARLIGTSHRIYYPRWQPRLERLLSRWQEAIVVDSAAVGDILRAETRIEQRKYVVIHNGIDPEEFSDTPAADAARSALSLPSRVLVITCVAHLATHKGQQHLLEAFALVAGRHPDANLLLVGDGPLRAQLARRSAELGLAGRVHLPGARRDLPVVLAASDVVVLPSVFEGFGIVQAEAMHLGLPVLATNHGGSVEVVEDGRTGYLVPFGDVEGLAERLEWLLADPERRAEMGRAGKERADTLFTREAMVQKYDSLYRAGTRAG